MSRQLLAWAVALAVGVSSASYVVAADNSNDIMSNNANNKAMQNDQSSNTGAAWNSSSASQNEQTLEGRLVSLRTYAMQHLNGSSANAGLNSSDNNLGASADTNLNTSNSNSSDLSNLNNKSSSSSLNTSANVGGAGAGLSTSANTNGAGLSANANGNSTGLSANANGNNAGLSANAGSTANTGISGTANTNNNGIGAAGSVGGNGATASLNSTPGMTGQSDTPFGIESNGKLYTIVADANELSRYQDQQVRITGRVEKQADLILPSKFEVKKNGSFQAVALMSIHPLNQGNQRTASEQY